MTFPVIELTKFRWKNILYEPATKQNSPLWVCCHVNEHGRLSDMLSVKKATEDGRNT
jgi:hypothetical protein